MARRHLSPRRSRVASVAAAAGLLIVVASTSGLPAVAAAEPGSSTTGPPSGSSTPETGETTATSHPSTASTATTTSTFPSTASTAPGPSSTALSSTVAPSSTAPSSTAAPRSTSSTVGTDPAVDPLAGEAPAEEAPRLDPAIPPPETYGGQEPYQPPEILWSSVAEAERKLERSRQAKVEAVAQARALRLRSKHLAIDRSALDRETRRAIAGLERATERYRGRAVVDFQMFAASVGPLPAVGVPAGPTPGGSTPEGPTTGDSTMVGAGILGGPDEVLERRRGARLAEAALMVGQDDIARLAELRLGLGAEVSDLLAELRIVSELQVDAERAAVEADAEIAQAEIEYEAFRAGSEIFVSGVVFPIAGPYDRPLIDSFGFPRMAGTPDEHWHEGIDLFAARGTPLVAAERGLVTRAGVGRLGGLKLWLVGESGSEWYYAHLDSFAPGLHDGQVVEAGQLVGHVGNTGNAVGTPPHLHLQLHPDGGRPVNPYPLLANVADVS